MRKTLLSLILLPMICTILFSATNILLIGDSVSKIAQNTRPIPAWFDAYIAEFVPGQWVVVQDTVNNQQSITIVTNYNAWVNALEPFDWVVLNYGLHDASSAVTDSAYKARSCIIADSLSLHSKKVIFCLTTPKYMDSAKNARIDNYNIIVKQVYDSIMGVGNAYYVDQNKFYYDHMDLCVLSDVDSTHFSTGSYPFFALNTFDTMMKYIPFEVRAQTVEHSSYGIVASDTNTTSVMSGYSSYGTDARGFNDYWRVGAGYIDSVSNWSNDVVPDSLDNVVTTGGGNKLMATEGETYRFRILSLSGTAEAPDTLQGAGAGATYTGPQDTLSNTLVALLTCTNPLYLDSSANTSGNNVNVKSLSYTGVTKNISSGRMGDTIFFEGPGFAGDCFLENASGSFSAPLVVTSYTTAYRVIQFSTPGIYNIFVKNGDLDKASVGAFTLLPPASGGGPGGTRRSTGVDLMLGP